jgi:hypothetical protein
MMKPIARALPICLSLLLVSLPAPACDPGARVFFVHPFHRATVMGPVRVLFGSEIVEVKAAPAGEQGSNTGHYDLIIDQAGGVPIGVPVFADKQHLRFDRGETEAQLELPPGKHLLTLQFVDGANLSHGVEMSASIEITVLDGPPGRRAAGMP